jgi:hypothetical protein
MSWYGNPWVIGIVGGIPSGFVVNWISRYTLGRRENREYLQKILGANREIVYAVRPGISEGQIPAQEVLQALVNATARRYGVEPKDLFGPQEIAEELTKEVMDSSFISSSQKADYCQKLTILKAAPDGEATAPRKIDTEIALSAYRARSVERMSAYLGFLTAALAIVFSMLVLSKANYSDTHLLNLTGHIQPLFPALLATLTVTLTMAAYPAFRSLSRQRERQRALERAQRQIEFLKDRVYEGVRVARSATRRKDDS